MSSAKSGQNIQMSTFAERFLLFSHFHHFPSGSCLQSFAPIVLFDNIRPVVMDERGTVPAQYNRAHPRRSRKSETLLKVRIFSSRARERSESRKRTQTPLLPNRYLNAGFQAISQEWVSSVQERYSLGRDPLSRGR
jgi:hypothetical protein